MRARLAKDPHADLTPYRDYELAHIWDRAQFYDQLAKRVVGRPVKQYAAFTFQTAKRTLP